MLPCKYKTMGGKSLELFDEGILNFLGIYTVVVN